MHYGLTPWQFQPLSAAALSEQAAFAESLGYESFWLPENHFNDDAIPDPLMLLAAVAAATHTIKLATTSFLLPLRNPLLAAEQVAVLDRLSQGRVLLGVGRGYSRETLHAFDIDPSTKRARFEWNLELMIRAWSGESVSLHDDGSAAVNVNPLPVQRPHPPLWVAAFGPKALAQVGRLGLPYLAAPIDTFDELQKNYELYDSAVAEAGHEPVGVRPTMRTVFMSDDQATVSALRDTLASVKLPRGLTASPQVDDWAIIGAPEEVRDKIAKYRDALHVTHLIVTHLRVDGIAPGKLRDSVRGIAELLIETEN
jgi:alkanesulfonate monooxygenase SsuD/methylene tetrahydromethanopterin reductase-like flavin-dependent oxidoreductase (luciferase family)